MVSGTENKSEVAEELPSDRVLMWRMVGCLALLVAVVIWAFKQGEPIEIRSARNLEFGIVRATLDGRHYNIPVRYMYTEGYEKHGASKYWAPPKKERLRVDYLSISLLLPDQRPYYVEDDARWKMLGWNDKLFVTLSRRGDEVWFPWLLEFATKQMSEGKIYARIPDEMGFLTLKTKGETEYLSKQKSYAFRMRCGDLGTAPHPSCSVKSNYKHGFALEYSFSIKYKERWKEIDEGLKLLFDEFEQAGGRPEKELGKTEL